jgi:hypothetical protein
MKKYLSFLIILLTTNFAFSQNAEKQGVSVQPLATFNSAIPGGNWTAGGSWNGGTAPGLSNSDNVTIVVGSTVTVNGNLDVNGGGALTVRGSLIDASGGTAYTFNIGNTATLDVYGTMTIEGAFVASNTVTVWVHGCATLNTGSMSFANNTVLIVDACASLNVTGNLVLMLQLLMVQFPFPEMLQQAIVLQLPV